MDSFELTIREYAKEYPDFEYYLKHAQEIKLHSESHPDIAIECCTSLLQGLSKAVYFRLEPQPDEKKFNNDAFQYQVKTALSLLGNQDDALEIALPQACSHLARIAGELRNKRGDISHGRNVPKELRSDASLSRLAMDVTEALARYMFANLVILEDLPEDYAANQIFNESLDSEGMSIGSTPYSKLLYDNDRDAYVDALDRFKAAREGSL